MSDLYDDMTVDALLDSADDDLVEYAYARRILDAVAPLIAAKALRDLADASDNPRLPVLDGGSSYIDLRRRADEIEAGQ